MHVRPHGLEKSCRKYWLSVNSIAIKFMFCFLLFQPPPLAWWLVSYHNREHSFPPLTWVYFPLVGWMLSAIISIHCVCLIGLACFCSYLSWWEEYALGSYPTRMRHGISQPNLKLRPGPSWHHPRSATLQPAWRCVSKRYMLIFLCYWNFWICP